MAHFIPKFDVSSSKFSEGDLLAPNYSMLSTDDRMVMGLNQNALASIAGSDAIIKSSEAQYKAVLAQNEEANVNSQRQVEATLALNDSINSGFNAINGVIADMSSSLDMGFQALIEQQIIANTKIDDLIKLIQIPEFEKERVHFFSEAIKFLKQGLTAKSRYQDALDNLLKAYELNKTDYIVSHQIGLLYLYNKDFLDLVKAEKFLNNAADYGSSFGDKFAALSYQHLAYCQELQLKLEDAISNARAGHKIDSSIVEFKMIELECEYILGNLTNVYNVIKEECDKDLSIIPLIRYNEILKNDFNTIDLIDQYENKLNVRITSHYNKLVKYRPVIDLYYKDEYQYDDGSDENEYPSVFSVIGYGRKGDYSTSDILYELFRSFGNSDDFDIKLDGTEKLNKLVSIIERQLSDNNSDLDLAVKAYQVELDRPDVTFSPIQKEKPKEDTKKIVIAVVLLCVGVVGVLFITDKFEIPFYYVMGVIILGVFLYNKYKS